MTKYLSHCDRHKTTHYQLTFCKIVCAMEDIYHMIVSSSGRCGIMNLMHGGEYHAFFFFIYDKQLIIINQIFLIGAPFRIQTQSYVLII